MSAAGRDKAEPVERARNEREPRRRRRRRPGRLAVEASRWLHRLPLERTLEVLTATIVLGSVLAIGAVHPPVMIAAAALSACALAAAYLLGPRDDGAPSKVWPAFILWALAGWCAVQLIPLPLGVLETIAPANADIWARALSPFAQSPPAFAPITLDPGATSMEAMRWFSYGALFIAAATISARRGCGWGVTVMFGVAVVAGSVTLAHGLLGAQKVYGLYTPSVQPLAWHVGPLLNPNNLAGLLNLGALCGLGLLVTDKAPLPRWIAGVGVALLLAVGVASASRGGVLMLLGGVIVLAVVTETSRSKRRSSPHARWLLVGVVALGAALTVLGSTRGAWRELLDNNAEKLKMAGMVEPAIADFSIFGMGRGAFESVFPAYQHAQGGVVYTHAENFVAQWAAEWGLPVTIAALLAFGWHFRPQRLGVRRGTLESSAFIGVVVLLIQNLVDLGLEVPALSFGLAFVLGTLWGAGHRPGSERHVSPISQASRRRALAAIVVFGLLAAGAAWSGGVHDLFADRRDIRESLKRVRGSNSEADAAQLRSELHAAMRRHPAEPYFPLIGATLAWERRDQNPIPWLQRVLERSLANGRAHLLLAHVLMRHGAKKQALLELRLAVESDPTVFVAAAKSALRFTQEIEELAEAIPNNELAGRSWEILGRFAGNRRLGSECDQRALKADPSQWYSRQRLVDDLIKATIAGDDCSDSARRTVCGEVIEAHVAAIAQETESSLPDRLRARWLAAIGKAGDGEALLARQCQRYRDSVSCARARVMVARQLDAERFGEAAKALRVRACSKPSLCAQTNEFLGGLYGERGEWGASVAAFERAARDDSTVERLLRLGDAATSAGLHSKAVRAFEKALRRNGGPDPKIQARLDVARRRLTSSVHRAGGPQP